MNNVWLDPSTEYRVWIMSAWGAFNGNISRLNWFCTTLSKNGMWKAAKELVLQHGFLPKKDSQTCSYLNMVWNWAPWLRWSPNTHPNIWIFLQITFEHCKRGWTWPQRDTKHVLCIVLKAFGSHWFLFFFISFGEKVIGFPRSFLLNSQEGVSKWTLALQPCK